MNFRNGRLTALRKGNHHTDSIMPVAVSRRKRLTSLLLIGSVAAIIGFALIPAQKTDARPTFTGGNCSSISPYTGCHSGAQTPSMMTISGLPTGSYVPGQIYTIKVTITDTNGASTGQNAFDMLVTDGTLSTTDPNVLIVDPATEAKANTGVDLKLATTFNVTWTAPLTGSPSFEIWAVMGDGASGTLDIWDREAYSYSAVPEFPAILLPIIGIGCAVVLASVLSKRK